MFPDAQVKFYLDASPEVRAGRRQKELADRGKEEPLERILEELNHRDQSDRSRRIGPLKAADDAIVVDTTEMTIDQVVGHLLELVRRRTGG